MSLSMRNDSKENDGTFVRAGGNHVPARILATLGTNEMKMFGPGAGLDHIRVNQKSLAGETPGGEPARCYLRKRRSSIWNSYEQAHFARS